MQGAHSSEGERGVIAGLRRAGLTIDAIVAHPDVHLSKSSVKRWVRRYEGEGFDGLKTKPRSGRPKVVEDEDSLIIRTSLMARPFASLREIVMEVTPHLGPHMRSVYERVKKEKLRCYMAAQKPKLTERQKELRLAFAYAHVNEPVELWRASPVTDEKSFRSNQTRKKKVWRPPGERYNPEYCQERSASGRVTAMLWGACSADHGSLGFVSCPPHMTAVYYRDECLVPLYDAMRQRNNGQEFRFTHDKAGIHTAHVIRNYLAERPLMRAMDDWPPNSPDLHWIENVWGLMSLRWETRWEFTRAELIDHARAEWEWLCNRPNILRRLADSMPARLQLVIDKNGAATKY